MARTLEGKSALVTGGGVGIGLAIAGALAAEGARVAVTYRNHEPGEDVLRDMARASGVEPLAVRADATSPAEVTALAERIRAEFGGLDILVNNVGGLVERSTIEEMSFDL